MNERIRKLLIQCEKKYCQDHDDYFYDMEKFAELIVRECADHLVSTHGQVLLAIDLKKIFGVEE